MSKLIRTSLGLATFIGLSAGAASAQASCRVASPAPIKPCVNCAGPVTGTSTLPPLSSYFEHQANCTHNKPFVPKPKPIDCSKPSQHGHRVLACYPLSKPPSAHALTGQTGIFYSGPQASVVQNPVISTNITQSGSGTVTVNQSPTISTSITQSGGGVASVVQNPTISTSIAQNGGGRAFVVQNPTIQTNVRQSGNGSVFVSQNPTINTTITQNSYQQNSYHHGRVTYPRPVPRPIYPAPRPTYYRVVRPVIAVPYPVPTPVPVCTTSACAPKPYRTRSRYGY